MHFKYTSTCVAHSNLFVNSMTDSTFPTTFYPEFLDRFLDDRPTSPSTIMMCGTSSEGMDTPRSQSSTTVNTTCKPSFNRNFDDTDKSSEFKGVAGRIARVFSGNNTAIPNVPVRPILPLQRNKTPIVPQFTPASTGNQIKLQRPTSPESVRSVSSSIASPTNSSFLRLSINPNQTQLPPKIRPRLTERILVPDSSQQIDTTVSIETQTIIDAQNVEIQTNIPCTSDIGCGPGPSPPSLDINDVVRLCCQAASLSSLSHRYRSASERQLRWGLHTWVTTIETLQTLDEFRETTKLGQTVQPNEHNAPEPSPYSTENFDSHQFYEKLKTADEDEDDLTNLLIKHQQSTEQHHQLNVPKVVVRSINNGKPQLIRAHQVRSSSSSSMSSSPDRLTSGTPAFPMSPSAISSASNVETARERIPSPSTSIHSYPSIRTRNSLTPQLQLDQCQMVRSPNGAGSEMLTFRDESADGQHVYNTSDVAHSLQPLQSKYLSSMHSLENSFEDDSSGGVLYKDEQDNTCTIGIRSLQTVRKQRIRVRSLMKNQESDSAPLNTIPASISMASSPSSSSPSFALNPSSSDQIDSVNRYHTSGKESSKYGIRESPSYKYNSNQPDSSFEPKNPSFNSISKRNEYFTDNSTLQTKTLFESSTNQINSNNYHIKPNSNHLRPRIILSREDSHLSSKSLPQNLNSVQTSFPSNSSKAVSSPIDASREMKSDSPSTSTSSSLNGFNRGGVNHQIQIQTSSPHTIPPALLSNPILRDRSVNPGVYRRTSFSTSEDQNEDLYSNAHDENDFEEYYHHQIQAQNNFKQDNVILRQPKTRRHMLLSGSDSNTLNPSVSVEEHSQDTEDVSSKHTSDDEALLMKVLSDVIGPDGTVDESRLSLFEGDQLERLEQLLRKISV